MVQASNARHSTHGDALVADLAYPADAGGPSFSRADLVFAGVDHAHASYEVRCFLNNREAGPNTERIDAAGYAGRFHVFGHGGCYGDVGHCDVPMRSTDPTDLRPPHPLTPLDTYVTITRAVHRLLAGGTALESLTMVPISLTPRRRDRAPALDLFRFQTVELHMYLTPSAVQPIA